MPSNIKKYLLPASEEIFASGKATGKIRKKTTFKLNDREIEALNQLDEIMSRPHSDFFYFKKRKKAIIVPSKIPCKAMPKLRKLLLDPELLSNAVEWSWKNYPKIWEDLGKQCLGCGICTYVCPLCYCFSIEDKCDLSGEKTSRIRKWTACTLPEFSRIAGGHKFHKSIKERYYNWFYHKFVRAYKEYGKSQCVACGKCKDQCPAGINIEEVLIKICKIFISRNK